LKFDDFDDFYGDKNKVIKHHSFSSNKHKKNKVNEVKNEHKKLSKIDENKKIENNSYDNVEKALKKLSSIRHHRV